MTSELPQINYYWMVFCQLLVTVFVQYVQCLL